MKRTLLFTAVLATAAGLSALGAAQAAPDTPQAMTQSAQWMPLAELIEKLENQGYTVLEAEREDGRYWEVKMRDANGMVVEAYLDPATGAPAERSGRGAD